MGTIKDATWRWKQILVSFESDLELLRASGEASDSEVARLLGACIKNLSELIEHFAAATE
ncbi:MAG TPA: hypothetical protein VKS60_13840 [Stellaceae bacterium]|nr:hypothetical protein [Stellaceae bacterium]